MLEQSVSYSIVLIGNMNPSIHHPSWYGRRNAISADEELLALTDTNQYCGPAAAGFRTAQFTIGCVPDRWAVETENKDNFERIVDLACDTFDGGLPETPISAFGFNFVHKRKTASRNVARLIADRIRKRLSFGLESIDPTSGAIVLEWKGNGPVIALRIEPYARNLEWVFIAINCHYDLTSITKNVGRFDLAPHVREKASSDLKMSEALAGSIVSHIAEDPEGSISADTA